MKIVFEYNENCIYQFNPSCKIKNYSKKKAYDANLAGILLELHYKALLKYEGASNTS